MAFEQKNLSGALFKNDKKQSPQQPDYRGDCVINGVPMWISAWIKDGKNGKFMSLAFQEKESHGEENQTRRQPQQNKPTNKAKQTALPQDDGDADSVPF